jgi:hypothetical protein
MKKFHTPRIVIALIITACLGFAGLHANETTKTAPSNTKIDVVQPIQFTFPEKVSDGTVTVLSRDLQVPMSNTLMISMNILAGVGKVDAEMVARFAKQGYVPASPEQVLLFNQTIVKSPTSTNLQARLDMASKTIGKPIDQMIIVKTPAAGLVMNDVPQRK